MINGGFEGLPGGRLGKNVIEADRGALSSVHFVSMSRNCEQYFVLELLVFTKKPCEMNPIQFGHSQVEQNDVRYMGFCGFKGCEAIIYNVGFVSM